MVRVNDIYGTIQGEGAKTGVPMVILRLQGCSVGCPFCDTKETWELRERDRVPALAEALGRNPRWTGMTEEDVAAHIRREFPTFRWVMITGGEPAEQELGPLVEALRRTGMRIALETSGTSDRHLGVDFDWVCVSPKTGMPGGQDIKPEVMRGADEIKHVVGKRGDIELLDRLLSDCGITNGVEICLQPMSQSEVATRLCVRTAQERGWRLSAQLHKYLDLP